MELSDADELADRIRRRWHEDRDIIDSGWWETFLRSLAAVSRRRRELEHSFDEALRREKLASLKELAYGAGHEINNPLANISSRAQTLLRDETDPERRQKLATINRQAFRVYEMISNMMHFAHPPAISPRPVDVVAIADQVLAELSEEAAEQGTEIGVEASSETVEAFADPVHLAAALKALCQNSLEAIAAGGHVRVAMRREKDADGRRGAVLEVADDGPGLSEQARRHLFDPFYSGREAGRGLGFGLSKCWRVVELHGGHVEVAGDDRGTRFTIWLPDAEFATTVAQRPDAQAEVAG